MKELETELEAGKQKKEEDMDEKRLLQEGAERMKEIGRKSIVDKMIIVDTLLNFLLIVTAVVLCKRQIDIEGADAGYYIAAMVFSFGFIIAFFIYFLHSLHSAKCSSTSFLLSSLHTLSRYNGIRSLIISHFIIACASHLFYDHFLGSVIGHSRPAFTF